MVGWQKNSRLAPHSLLLLFDSWQSLAAVVVVVVDSLLLLLNCWCGGYRREYSSQLSNRGAAHPTKNRNILLKLEQNKDPHIIRTLAPAHVIPIPVINYMDRLQIFYSS
jgi:hypothetical protein